MLMFKVAFSLFLDTNQSASSTLDWVLNNQSDFDWVLYQNHWQFSINKKIIPMLTCPIANLLNLSSGIILLLTHILPTLEFMKRGLLYWFTLGPCQHWCNAARQGNCAQPIVWNMTLELEIFLVLPINVVPYLFQNIQWSWNNFLLPIAWSWKFWEGYYYIKVMTMNTEKFQRVHVALDSVSISTMQYLSEISIKVIQPHRTFAIPNWIYQ